MWAGFRRSIAIATALLTFALVNLPQAATAQFVQQGGKLVGSNPIGSSIQGGAAALSADGNTAIIGGWLDDSSTGAAWVFTRDAAGTWTQQGGKLVGNDAVGAARQGRSVALSADGNTAIIGGSTDNSNLGAAWIFTRDSSGTWTQQGPKLVGTDATGSAILPVISVALSADGNTALVGRPADNGNNGATWVFTREVDGTWTQQGLKLIGSGATSVSRQGVSVALSADGNTALVGGNNDNSGVGAMWVFTRDGGTWTQQGAKLVDSGVHNQGAAVALSADGNTAVVGASQDNAILVFVRDGNGNWTQQGAKLTGSGGSGVPALGVSVALSADANTAIGGGSQDDSGAGAVWVFTRDGNGTWTQQGTKLVGSGAIGTASQGSSVALSADGNTLIVGGDNDDGGIGATWVFVQPAIVTSVSPNAGPIEGGSLVSIVGQHFTGATAVTFGGVAATDLLVVDDSFLVATAPAHAAGPVDVAVTTSAGMVISAGAYTYDGKATTTVLLSSGTPTVFGQPVTFTAVVGSGGTPSGTVTFMDGATPLGSASLSASVATLTTAALTGGPHTITASYGGDGTFVASTSSSLAQTISAGGTATALTARPSATVPGGMVRLTADVSALAPSTGMPHGTVRFRHGLKLLGSATLSNGKATLRTTALGIGVNGVRAHYVGNANWAASTSTVMTETIEARRGRQFPVNSFDGAKADRKQRPAVARLADGGFVVVWQSQNQDGSAGGIYGQRYRANGARNGGEFRINTATKDDQAEPDVAAVSDGGFVVVWTSEAQDGSGLGIYGQRYKNTGARRGHEFRVNATNKNDQRMPSVAGLGNGGFVVTWVSNAHPRVGNDIRGQRYGKSGTRIGREFVVNTTRVKNQTQPDVAALSNRGFVVTWTSDADPQFGKDIIGQRYNRRGAKAGGEFLVNATRVKNQTQPAVVGIDAGGFVVAWTSAGQDGSGFGVYAQRFHISGAKNGGEFRVNNSTHNSQLEPALTGFAGGGFVVVWTAQRKDGLGFGVHGQGFDNTGTAVSTEFRVNTVTRNNQWQPSAATLSASQFVVVWTAVDPATLRQGIEGQRFMFRGL